MKQRSFNQIDKLLIGINAAMDTVFSENKKSARPFPAQTSDNDNLSQVEKAQSARYMRVNHVGEVCAQALYQSQAITARNPDTRIKMQQAAAEEIDHLAWCSQRIEELGGRKSLLNPLWYSGSFAIGSLAGIAGDKWNLGFVAETEQQVVDHLQDHLGKLPENDIRSREVVSQMQIDESSHAQQAIDAGGAELPVMIKKAMSLASRFMTRTAHWI